MMIRLAALLLVALVACSKNQEAPATNAAPAAEAAPELVAEPSVENDVGADSEDNEIACPVLDSRNWNAWTVPAADGHSLTIEGEIDLPTPGFALIWRAGIADRAMPPGLRVHLDAVPPADVVMQVVTPTPVSWSMDRANAQYRVVYVLCGDEAIAEIANVGPKTE